VERAAERLGPSDRLDATVLDADDGIRNGISALAVDQQVGSDVSPTTSDRRWIGRRQAAIILRHRI
jgi:hypothetical protein